MNQYTCLPADTLMVEQEILIEKITSLGYKDKWTIADNQNMNKWREQSRQIREELALRSADREVAKAKFAPKCCVCDEPLAEEETCKCMICAKSFHYPDCGKSFNWGDECDNCTRH